MVEVFPKAQFNLKRHYVVMEGQNIQKALVQDIPIYVSTGPQCLIQTLFVIHLIYLIGFGRQRYDSRIAYILSQLQNNRRDSGCV